MNLTVLNNVGHPRRRAEGPEGFVSPASRHSLTVRGLRWLPRNSAARLEPSGCPGRRAGTQDGGEFRAREEDLELLRAIVNSRIFTEFGRAFTEATGLPVALRPVESFQLSFHDGRNQGPFCALMARENRTCGACLQKQAQVAGAAAERPHTTICYAGMCETVVPLRLGRRLIGFLQTGQVFRRKPTERQFQRTLKLLTNWGVGLEQDVLRGAYFGTRVVSREQLAAAVK